MHTHKIKMIRQTAFYSSANTLAQGIGILNSLFLRRFMGPANMGIWSILQVILGYCGYASFGTTKAMARDYPFYRGKGDFEKANQLKNLTLTFTMLMSSIPALLLLGYLFFKWTALDVTFKVGLVFILFFLFVQRFYDLVIVLCRSEKLFELLSWVIIGNAAGTFLVTVGFVYQWKIYGLYAGTALVTLVTLAAVLRYHPFDFKFSWNTANLLNELKLGIPLVATTFLANFLRSLDKILIAKMLSFYDVGLYSLAMMANSYISSLPMNFTHILFPNLQEEFGRQGSDPKKIKNYLIKPAALFAIICPLLSAVAIFYIPVLTHFFIPKFDAGLPAMKIYVMGIFFTLISQFSASFLITVDRYLIQFPILAVSILANWLMNLFFLHMGWGLTGVAFGTVLSFAIYGITNYVVALVPIWQSKDLIPHVFKIIFSQIFFSAAIFSIDRWINPGGILLNTLCKTLALLFLAVPFLILLEKKFSLFRLLFQTFWQKPSPMASVDKVVP